MRSILLGNQVPNFIFFASVTPHPVNIENIIVTVTDYDGGDGGHGGGSEDGDSNSHNNDDEMMG